ncbi:mannose-6-phosphate isomerase [Marchantia polymorpha subsp. ruderalis]|uniref:mannose-6-phosphate isomerase n=1 Tax=Marchantia polymorpha TaxID=3197 RepID=A0A2R6WKB4_MARPO|nr:hypothetical protein MARPO_0082s0088 [Marchantia polymorpha]BBN02513.1 hypothetical protein Mp_2g15930 [Marchantia polymorpha subsp. ruderalis]|eukprot:PTQ34261.1 hypothetical protein MARPO_0082s0088 [Marchantia polymorpha]
MLRLQVSAQNYDWGRIGEESEVGRLYGISSGKEVQHDVPYAELWMGTHPSGPSFISDAAVGGEPQLLKDWLLEHHEALGDDVFKHWQGELPFLFKVLSIAKALSIQAHPDKKLAEQLHLNQGNVYKDPNHKPEMALALTNFEALCGFVTPEELKEVLETVPELKALLKKNETEMLLDVETSKQSIEAAASALRQAFTTIMTLEKETVTERLGELIKRLKEDKEVRKLSSKEELALLLERQYPDDVGVFASFFLNYIKLVPGEAVYLAANVPHAYISGECIECMATSDNVVRAGLTPKFRDTETLCSMLTYEQGLPDILNGSIVSPYTRRYSPPFDEFEVDRLDIPEGDSLEFAAIPGPSIFLVFDGRGSITFLEGDASPLQRGDIFFLPAGTHFTLFSKSEVDSKAANGVHASRWAGMRISEAKSLRLFRAGVNSRIFKF